MMIPHEKELVASLKDKPFALLGINSDEAGSVSKILKDNGITWRQSVQGSPSGPLPTQWGVRGWPTIYVLDHKGVVRFKDVRGQDMTDAVMKLIEEAEKDASKVK